MFVTDPARAGRICFGLGVAGSGVMQIGNAEFVRIVTALPEWVLSQPAIAVACGVVLLGIGAAIVAGWRTRVAAIALVVLLAVALALKIPGIASNPWAGFVWTNPAKVLALVGGALLVGGGSPRLAILPGVFLLICGIQHFVYAGFVDTLVPAWIPPGARFWTYLSAVALIAGGIGMLVDRTRHPAALLSSVMIFLWVPMLHIPRAIGMHSANELAGVFEALAIAGVCLLAARPVKSAVRPKAG
jgi:uncharacterized membrane protein